MVSEKCNSEALTLTMENSQKLSNFLSHA